MKKALHHIFIFLLVYNFANGQSTVQHQVLLLGNLADVVDTSAFLTGFEKRLEQQQTPFTVVLNGDVAGSAQKIKAFRKSMALLYKLMDVMSLYPDGLLIVMPGDRDWNNSRKGGQKAVGKLEDKVKDYYKKNNYTNVKWVVKKQCPGPKVIERNEHLMLIAINTQWWNHPFDKPLPADGKCTGITPYDFKEELEDAVHENKDKNILLLGHHPFYSVGNYGGHFSFADHLKPFPVVGSFRAAFHRNIGNHLDIENENLETLREELRNLYFFNDNLVFASGHEHNSFILKAANNYLINSGGLAKGKFAGKDKYTVFTSRANGWMELHYDNNGTVKALFVPLNPEKTNAFETTLFRSACTDEQTDAIPVNNAFVPCKKTAKATEKMTGTDKGITQRPAGEKYKKGRCFTFWFGKHYRSTWTTPVSVPFLNLDTTKNGLRVLKKGGGRQTTSLRFIDGNGASWTFRSVDKDPSKTFDYKLRPTIASAVVRDQTSTQHPYGALVVAGLLDHLDILHARPKLYVLPDDTKLGVFQKDYAHLFGMLEESPGKRNLAGQRFGNADKIMKSSQFFNTLYKNSANRVHLSKYLRARVFDMLIGDWSKHEDNWKWAGFKKKKGMIYEPIPRDRDHAFSTQDGILPWLADRRWGLKNIEHFGYKINGFKSLMMQARTLDRPLASEAMREDWLEEARYIQEALSDEKIDAAVQQMPPEVYELSGKLIASKLKKRLENLPASAEKYYRILAKAVDVIGSNKAEFIDIDRQPDGRVAVNIYDLKKNGEQGALRFTRIFLPEETKEIRVYALGGNDVFDIRGAASSRIKIRLLGGPGKDVFSESGERKRRKTLLYDKEGSTQFELAKGAKVKRHWNKDVYKYDRQAFLYNRYLPVISLGYNRFTGFSFGGGAAFTNYAFGKEDYSSKHRISGGLSTKGNIMLEYESRYRQVFRRWDFLLNANIQNPSFHNNFYGLGNNTPFAEELEADDFYETEINTYHFDIGIGNTFWKKSTLDFLVGIERVKTKNIAPALLDESPFIVGANTTLDILPAVARLDINFLDNNGLPYSGTRLQVEYTNGTILGGNGAVSNFGVVQGSIAYFLSGHRKNPFTLGLRAGGAAGHGERPFYKLPALGTNRALRGYPGNRFTGESSLYLNTELRKQLFQRYTEIVPVKFGVKAFFDAGRVFYREAQSKTWHYGYGAGIYLVPFEEFITLSFSLAFSEEQTFYPVFGLATPLR